MLICQKNEILGFVAVGQIGLLDSPKEDECYEEAMLYVERFRCVFFCSVHGFFCLGCRYYLNLAGNKPCTSLGHSFFTWPVLHRLI